MFINGIKVLLNSMQVFPKPLKYSRKRSFALRGFRTVLCQSLRGQAILVSLYRQFLFSAFRTILVLVLFYTEHNGKEIIFIPHISSYYRLY